MDAEDAGTGTTVSSVSGALGIATAAIFISLLISLAMGTWLTLPFVLVVTLVLSLLVGMPIFLALRTGSRANWLSVSAGGFFTGAIVPALLILPGPGAQQASIGGVPTVIDGRYTAAGWWNALQMIGAFGAAGIIGAWTAWYVIGWASANAAVRRRRGIALAALAAAAIAGAAGLPWALMDRSCHNSLRDGRRSIASVAEIQLHVPMSEWTAVREALRNFAAGRRWSFQADVRPDREFPWFQASLCTEPGTLIFVQEVPFDGGYLAIGAYQPQGGEGWQAPLRALQDRIEARWPGRITYPSGDYSAPRPPWAPPAPAPTPAPSSAAR